jgi:CMP-2-keto-3-deoxyoctulosonic acid synthetase
VPVSRTAFARSRALEQLRALENGMEIRVALAVERPLADVNTAADLERAERALLIRP